MAGTPATLGPPSVGDEVATVVGPNRRANHEGLTLPPGFRLGHFEVIGTIGSGGMATVLKARDLELGRIVALKILPPESARDPDSVTRFKQEARAAAKLDHDNVARVFFCGEEKGLHFIAFEYVEGETLRTLIEQQVTLAPADCVRYLLQLAAGLQHASDRGVIHRDVKPSNIVITPDGKAKIIDMGLARQQGPHSVNGGVTQSGMTLGTFDYISPEQALDPRSVDVRSDIYSLGCSFYHALTGRPPVPEGTAAKKLHAHQHEPPTDPRQLNPLVTDAFAVVLSGMMVKDRDRRYASPDALIRDLLAVAESMEIPIDPNMVSTVMTRSGTGQVRALTGTQPRRWTLGLALGGVVAIASVIVLIITLGRGSKPVVPAWEDDFGRTERTTKILDLPPNPNTNATAKQTVQPANAEALVVALGQSNVKIQLVPGQVYDLSATAGAVFAGKELEMETLSGSTPATLKLAAAPVKWDDNPTGLRDGALTVSGAESVRFQGVKFQFAQKPGSTDDPLTPPIGLFVDSTAKLELLQCQFELDSSVTASDGVGVCVNRGTKPGSTETSVRNATVALRRWVGFELTGAVKADFTECGFVTSRVGIRLSGEGTPPSLALQFCTFLLENRGVAVDVERSSATVQAGFSLFASGNTDPPAMMMTEPGERKPALLRTATGSQVTATATQPNAFYRVDAPANWDTAIELKKHPWATTNPTAKLDTAEPWKTFELNPNHKPLRVPNRDDVKILGVKQLPNDGTKIYGTWPPSGTQSDVLPPGVKVWYPNPPVAEKDSLPTNVFDNLAQALAALKPNDKLLIRGNGTIEVPTLPAITKADFNVTIRPEDENSAITLIPAETNRLDSTMFRVEEGDIRFERLEFRLKPTVLKAGDLKSQSIITLAGGGRRCEFHQCVITMEQQKDEVLAAVTLVDMSEAMRKNAVVRRPTIRMEDCVIRGRGRAVWATTAFPFDFAASNVLAALSSPFVELEAPAKPSPSGAIVHLQLAHVTAILGSNLIDLQCAKPLDDKPGAFVPVEIRTEGCLFVPATADPAPFAIVNGGDGTLWEKYLTWTAGTASGYGNFPESAAMLEVAVDDPDAKGKRIGINDWLAASKEKATDFGKVTLNKTPEGPDGLLTIRPDDAAVKDSSFGSTVGCRVKDLPKPGK